MCSGLHHISSRGPDRVPLSPAGICCGTLPWGWPRVQRRLVQTLEPCEGLPPTGVRSLLMEYIFLNRPTARIILLDSRACILESRTSYSGRSERKWDASSQSTLTMYNQSGYIGRTSSAVLTSERSMFDAVAATSSGVSRKSCAANAQLCYVRTREGYRYVAVSTSDPPKRVNRS